MYRRFTRLRTRLLLTKQDKLSVMEKRLEKFDRDEDIQLRLGSCQEDDNPERQLVLAEIDTALADYGMQRGLRRGHLIILEEICY